MQRGWAETLVGFVVVGVAVWFVWFAYGQSDLRPVAGYAVSAKFNSVGGLAAGGDVRIGGVKVGSVTGLNVDAADYRAVVTFTVRADIRLPDDTVAAVTSDGLLGGKYLRLEVGRSAQPVAPGGRLAQTRDSLSLEDLLGKAIFLLTEDAKPKESAPPEKKQ
jgi:phospholipid/cholesterol/gamma-HCH transport system substrate-binding protein